ncbi:DUF6118 family protein [Flavisphingomonas formosensis]|uniref:DUF6118 family protein n=1 Tax=Flavisphingomonas formosensis TaxID=861534 RepID=UPI0012FBAF57|nr:DUF6118 family protein [Sphingomonas formosensis]
MDQDSSNEGDTGTAAQAFAELRAEVSLLRRGIERLTDERTAQPDYAPTLEAMAKSIDDICTWARRVSERPALRLTPESLAREITAAAANSRAEDRKMLGEVAGAMNAAVGRIDGMVARSRSVREQKRLLNGNRAGFAAAGMLLWAILPGVVARSLPQSWAVPERMAARVLRMDMGQAGRRMMAAADFKNRAPWQNRADLPRPDR